MIEKAKGVSPAGEERPLSRDFIVKDDNGIGMKTLPDMIDVAYKHAREGVIFYIYSPRAQRMVDLRHQVHVRALSIDKGENFTISIVGPTLQSKFYAMRDFSKCVKKNEIAHHVRQDVKTKDQKMMKERHTTQILRLTTAMEKGHTGNGIA